MKKIIIVALLSLIGIPGFCACDIRTGFCAPDGSVFAEPSLKSRYAPNSLDSVVSPGALIAKPKKRYDLLLNTDTAESPSAQPDENSYNSNCQFGICLPGSGMTNP